MPVPEIAFNTHDIAGNVSYILIALSYYLTNIYWLRVTAVVGLTCEILYFALSGGAMHTGIAWNCVFIAINLYQISFLIAERVRLRSVGPMEPLRLGALEGLTRAQFARVAATGRWRTFDAEAPLTREGEPVDELLLIVEGRAGVVAGRQIIAQLGPGAFVGEMAFLSGQPATASVMPLVPLKAFAFDAARLSRVMASDEALAAALHRAVGIDLVRKLRATSAA